MPPRSWTVNEFLAPRIRLHHPATTRAGKPIRVDEDDHGGRRRVHLIAPDRSEIYFELVLYPEPLDIATAIASQRSYLIHQDETKSDVAMSEPEQTDMLGTTADQVRVDFTDEDGRFSRLFSFGNFADATEPWALRVVFDPSSPINHEILERLEIAP